MITRLNEDITAWLEKHHPESLPKPKARELVRQNSMEFG